jgi:hypothetical protein
VRATAQHGIQGVLPIVVPSQTTDWWLDNAGYAELELLVRQALAWGIPKGSPLCLDIEEHQSEKMNNAVDVARAWAIACEQRGLRPWAYGSASFLDKDIYNNRWLAEWPNVTPVDPDPPKGYRAWQYKGNDNGIDHDVFLANEIFLSPHLKPVKIDAGGLVTPAVEPAPLGTVAAHAVEGAGDTNTAPSGETPADPSGSDSTQTPPGAAASLESSKS